MNILNLHGYQGSVHNSAYQALQTLPCRILSPSLDYDHETPEQIMGKLNYLVADRRIELIVGTSLGGFYAVALSAELHLPVILVNPFLMPFLRFPESVKSYISLFGTLAKLESSKVSCIVGAEDEVLGDHALTQSLLSNARFRSIPGGKHSGATLPLVEYFREMLHYYEVNLPRKELAECVPESLFDDK